MNGRYNPSISPELDFIVPDYSGRNDTRQNNFAFTEQVFFLLFLRFFLNF